jgi:quinol monooxygenase YgiN
MNVVELRRYVLKPGRRDELIDLFEREFIETQEACGILPVAHCRDLDDPDRFIWLREYADMPGRLRALNAFYLDSDAWKENRDAANATLVDTDDVLLLRPARAKSGFDVSGLVRTEHRQDSKSTSFAAITALMLDAPADENFIAEFEREVLEELKSGAERVAYFVTEEQPNNFPRHPVRERDWAFVVAGICPDEAALQCWLNAFEPAQLPQPMRERIRACESLRLRPAARSLLH